MHYFLILIILPFLMQGSYSNKEIKFQYIPGWVELNFQDISGAVYHTNIDIKKLSRI